MIFRFYWEAVYRIKSDVKYKNHKDGGLKKDKYTSFPGSFYINMDTKVNFESAKLDKNKDNSLCRELLLLRKRIYQY